MPGCLSPEQLDDLLTGRLEQADQAIWAAHVEECAPCGQEFDRRTTAPEAERWRLAALETSAPAHEDLLLLESLKRLPPDIAQANGRGGQAIDYGEFFRGNSRDTPAKPDAEARLNRVAAIKARLPDVPGFEIQSELGRGGMGVVYRARQTAYNRPVALKMVLAGRQASAEDLGRFHDEAEAISRLRHPHIVQIFEVGQYDGRLYFVLEFVEGGNLADKISNKPLPARSSAQLVESLARAMHFAHSRGIIHRDLKPANVLLHGRKEFLDLPEAARMTEDWDFHRYVPKITDFGLAKLLDRGAGDGHTASGDVVGTPSYMAPEQAQGKPYALAAATDIYSLGAILYEMITGRAAFQGATPMDTLLKVTSEEPVRPRKIVGDIPGTLETICLKCLRKNPAHRYQSAEELAEDLRLFLEGLPIQTRGLHAVGRGLRSFQENMGQWFMAALVFVLAVLAGGLLIGLWKLEREINATVEIRPADAAVVRENAALRLRLAQSSCERGEIARGLVAMAALLDEVQPKPDLQSLRDVLASNIAMWAGQTPALIFVAPEWVSSAALVSGADGLEVAAETTDSKQVRWKVPGEPGSPRPPNGEQLIEKANLLARAPGVTVSAPGADGVLLTGSRDRTAKLWRVASGELIAVLPHPSKVEQIAFAKDGTTFLTRDAIGTVRVWRMPQELDGLPDPEIGGLPKSPADARVVARSPAGDQYVTMGEDGVPRLSLLSGKPEPLAIGAEWKCAAFSSDGRWLLTGWSDGVRLWDAASGLAIGPLLRLPSLIGAEFVQNPPTIRAWSASDARKWRFPPLNSPAAGELHRWVQSRTGLDLAADGSLRFLGADEWRRDHN